MIAEQRMQELGALLRSRRESLRPEDLQLPRGERRRAVGLRREEVAALSGVSCAWYTWLEQGRQIQPSFRLIGRIAETLRLSEDERVYVSLLAGYSRADDIRRVVDATPISISSIQRTLDAITAAPAILYDVRFDVLASNAAARAMYGHDVASSVRWERNMIWRFFIDADRRRMYPDAGADLGVRNLIEALRMNWAAGRDGEQGGVEELVDELRHVSLEFDEIWVQRRVARLATVAGRVRPLRDERAIDVEYTRLQVPDAPGYAIAVLVPSSDEAAARLKGYLDRAG
jgi:transcriptional regulator with XRE-family HTH domain